jgi:protoheme IX farnesyltransferase
MLPVTHGAKAARTHIFVYSILLMPFVIAPAFTGLGGIAYSIVAACGGAFFLFLAWRILRSRAGEGIDGADKPARDLFGYSILYLFALFAAILVEKAVGA